MHAEDILRPPLSRGAHHLAQRRVAQQPRNTAGERLRIARGHEDAVLVISHDFRDAADTRRHNRTCRRHRLERREAERFDARRRRDDVERLHELGRVGAKSEKPEPIAQAERRDAALHLLAHGAAGAQIVAEHGKHHVGVTQAIGRLDEFPDALHLGHLPGHSHHRPIHRQVQLPPPRGALCRVPLARQLHCIVDHRGLSSEEVRRLAEGLRFERLRDENRQREAGPEKPSVGFRSIRKAKMGDRWNPQQASGVAAGLVAGHVVRVDDGRAETEGRRGHPGDRQAAAERFRPIQLGDRHNVARNTQRPHLRREFAMRPGQHVRLVQRGVERAERHEHGALRAAEERRPGEIEHATAHRHATWPPRRRPSWRHGRFERGAPMPASAPWRAAGSQPVETRGSARPSSRSLRRRSDRP